MWTPRRSRTSPRPTTPTTSSEKHQYFEFLTPRWPTGTQHCPPATQHNPKDLQMSLQVFSYASILTFQGNIRPGSRPSERPGKLPCVLSPSTPLRARVPQSFGAVKGAPERHIPCGKPYDSPSALRHGADNRPKGHCGPSACRSTLDWGNRAAESRVSEHL